MIKSVLNKFENPKIPLLGPNVKALQFWGLLLSKNSIFKRCIHFAMYASVITFTITEYIDIWYIKSDPNLVMNNMKISLLAMISVCKVTSFLYWQQNWNNIVDYVTQADLVQRNTSDVIKKNIVAKYTKYCRNITLLYWSLVYTTAVSIILHPIIYYCLSKTYRDNVRNGTESFVEVVMSWVPFNKNTITGYLAASTFQAYATVYGSGIITSFDTNAMSIMVFFKGELELLKIDSANIYGTEELPVADDIAIERLKNCHKRHVELVKYASLFDSCLSPIMLLYMFVCSVMLCVTAYQITMESSLMQRFLAAEYLVFGVSQLFIYCWHSNDVMYTSQDLMMGPYESTWWLSNAKKRKDLYILIAQFKRIVVFNAGPFAKLTVPTFLIILRGAYSYYTLLSKKQS